MNRRNFISSLGVSAAGLTLGTSVVPRKMTAQSSGPNLSLYSASGSAHAIASANSVYGTPSGGDWTSVGNSLSATLSDWQVNGLDAQVQAVCGNVDPSTITSSNLNQAQILQNIQVFQPAFTLNDVQNGLAYLDAQSVSTIQSVITNIQQQGMSPYIQQLVQQAILLAPAIDTEQSGSGGGPSNMSVTTKKHSKSSSGISSNVNRIEQPPPNETGGYNCAVDGALIFAAGIAFATLTVMTLGADAVLVGAAWGAIATWGGLATTGWGIGHAVVGCSF